MSPEQMSEEQQQALSPVETKSAEELEAKFGLGKQIFGSLALAAAALGFSGEAEARTMLIEANTPEVSRVKADLSSRGVESFSAYSSMRHPAIRTNLGEVVFQSLKNEGETNSAFLERRLSGITADQFVKEIERQSFKGPGIQEQISMAHGIVKIDISPYATKVMEQTGIKYSNGNISSSNGKLTIDLTGSKTTSPNIECKIRGVDEFQDFVLANCTRLEAVDGKVSTSSVSYKITGDTSGGLKIEVADNR